MDYRIMGKTNCEAFSCRLESTCIFAPSCNKDCVYMADLCRVCALEMGCKSNKIPRYYKEGKYFYREIGDNLHES